MPKSRVSSPKGLLRRKFRTLREKLSESYRRGAAGKIADRLLRVAEWSGAKNVAIYMSKGSEVDTRRILKWLLSKKKAVSVPRVNKAFSGLDFFRIKGLQDCRPGVYGILEPNQNCPKAGPDKIDLLIVPGIVFDESGYRLGYGKGFYDRLLLNAPSIPTVGLTYEKAFVRSVPHDRKDAAVEYVVTDKKIYWTKGRQSSPLPLSFSRRGGR